ncbi:hypothetical protein C6P11_06890 [Weissella confusa]|uniref:Uncharacterized protein n=1 Tax=Weissella confusa TaxID=1583 RepID=A0A4Z0RYD9_WEICO|nr:hypothetical protein C6P11_06890 [Weissella confusa]
MAFWLFFVILFPRTHSYWWLDVFTQLPMVVFGSYVFIQAIKGRWREIVPSNRALMISLAVFIVQAVRVLISYNEVGIDTTTAGLIHGLIGLVELLIVVWLAWATVKLSGQNFMTIVRGAYAAFWIYFIMVLAPQFWVMIGRTETIGYVNGLAQLFERHWIGRDDFYQAGSYVTTQMRLNGFEPEAPFLAILIGVVFLPIFMVGVRQSLIIWRRPGVANALLLWVTLISAWLVLLAAKTTTGMLLVFVSVLLMLVTGVGMQRVMLLIIAVSGAGIGYGLYQYLQGVHDMFTRFLLEKHGTENRLGGTIGLLKTILQHPLFGVGYGFESPYIVENVPSWSKANLEYQNVYAVYGYPILSGFLGWFARFGLVLVLPMLYVVVQRFKVAWQNQNAASWAYVYFVALALVTSMFTFFVFAWPVLVAWFVYLKKQCSPDIY